MKKTIITVVSITVVSATISFYILPYIAERKTDITERNTARNLSICRSISLALLNYHDTWGKLPGRSTISNCTKNKPETFSWRYWIINFLESPMYADGTDCYKDPGISLALKKIHYFPYGIFGCGTAFTTNDLNNTPEDAILFICIRSTGCNWKDLCEIDIEDVDNVMQRKYDAQCVGETIALGFADGNLWILNKDTPVESIRRFLTIESAEMNERETLLGKYRISSVD